MKPLSGYLKVQSVFYICMIGLFSSINSYAIIHGDKKQSDDCNSGIYATKEDYLKGEFTKPFGDGCDCKIHTGISNLVWKCNGKKTRIKYENVFAYVKESEEFIIRDKNAYKVEEKRALYILSRESFIYVYRGGGVPVTNYYYLKDLDQMPQKITYKNLVSDFQDNPNVLNVLNANKGKDFSDIITVNGEKIFYINYLLQLK